MKLKDIAIYANDRVEVKYLSDYNYISTENMIPEKGGIQNASSLPSMPFTSAFIVDDVLISNIRPYFRKIWFADKRGGCSNDVLVLRAQEKCYPKFLYYVLSNNRFFDYSTASAKGTKMPRGDKSAIMEYEVPDFDRTEQIKIAKILSSFDDKIELNHRINDNLEQQAQALFNYYLIENPLELGDCTKGNLASIASYLNGLAMQKYRPTNGEDGIPVLKIKELGQGSCDSNSDLCSSNISPDYIVNDGDIIFSWSGTLMVDIWTGGKCGLNQHLFKVSSEKYPKWFVFYWTNHYLDKFIRIAKDKAVTMGHIKRSELELSDVIIPKSDKLANLNLIFNPLLDEYITKRIEIRELRRLKDELLPKLMSGELKINDLHS